MKESKKGAFNDYKDEIFVLGDFPVPNNHLGRSPGGRC